MTGSTPRAPPGTLASALVWVFSSCSVSEQGARADGPGSCGKIPRNPAARSHFDQCGATMSPSSKPLLRGVSHEVAAFVALFSCAALATAASTTRALIGALTTAPWRMLSFPLDRGSHDA